MTASLTPHLDKLNQEQIVALNKLIDEQNQLIDQHTYLSMNVLIKRISSHIENYDTYNAVAHIRQEIVKSLRDINKVEKIADMVSRVVTGLSDPIELLNEYQSKYGVIDDD